MPRRKDPRIPDAVLDQLLAGADPKTIFDPNGLLDGLKKALGPLAIAVNLVWSLSAAADCSCGPLYCLGAPDFPTQLAAKKASLAQEGAPPRLTALLNQDGQCPGCLDGAPDGFTILNVLPNGDNYTVPWDETNESISHKKVDSGELSVYYIFNSRKSCACCGEQRPEDRADYDSELGLNRNSAIVCHGSAPTASCP